MLVTGIKKPGFHIAGTKAQEEGKLTTVPSILYVGRYAGAQSSIASLVSSLPPCNVTDEYKERPHQRVGPDEGYAEMRARACWLVLMNKSE